MSVYFAQDSKNGWIKIGCSKNPKERIKSIPIAKGHDVGDLKLLKVVDGSFGEEDFCQRLLLEFQMLEKGISKREWFYSTDMVMALVEKSDEWFENVFEKRREVNKKYGRKVKYSFDGNNIIAKVK